MHKQLCPSFFCKKLFENVIFNEINGAILKTGAKILFG